MRCCVLPLLALLAYVEASGPRSAPGFAASSSSSAAPRRSPPEPERVSESGPSTQATFTGSSTGDKHPRLQHPLKPLVNLKPVVDLAQLLPAVNAVPLGLVPFPDDDDDDDTSDNTAGPKSEDAPIKLSAASIASSEDYIVKLRSGTDPEDIHTYIDSFNKQAGLGKAPRPRQVGENTSRGDPTSKHPNCLRRFLDPSTYKGVIVKLTPECLKRIQRKFRSGISYIERNGRMSATVTQRPSPSWGLARISNLRYSASAPYYFPAAAGRGVRVFVLDTGIQANHTEFRGRAKFLTSFVENEENTDLDGHGTHVAATIGGWNYGVAKLAWIYGVKVLDKTRTGTYADIVAGIQYAMARILPNKTVLNLSISGPVSQAVNDALTTAVARGIVAVVAAGNDGQDACNYSPASAKNVLSVGATDNTDSRASFSNYGKCVRIFAPGQNIPSAWAFGSRSNSGTAYMSGTSQACPHVAGVAALYMSAYNYPNVSSIYRDVIYASNWNVLRTASLNGSPNILAYNYQDPTQQVAPN